MASVTMAVVLALFIAGDHMCQNAPPPILLGCAPAGSCSRPATYWRFSPRLPLGVHTYMAPESPCAFAITPDPAGVLTPAAASPTFNELACKGKTARDPCLAWPRGSGRVGACGTVNGVFRCVARPNVTTAGEPGPKASDVA